MRGMISADTADRLRASGADETARAVRSAVEPLPPTERAGDFGALFDRFGSAAR